jgi:hypothetical protein
VSVLNVNRTCDDITSDSIDDEVLCDIVELEKKEKLLAVYYNILFHILNHCYLADLDKVLSIVWSIKKMFVLLSLMKHTAS